MSGFFKGDDEDDAELELPADGMGGVVKEWVSMDGIGTLALEDGRHIKFSFRELKGTTQIPDVGDRFHVAGLKEFVGNVWATSVEPVIDAFDLEEQVWPKPSRSQALEERWIEGEKRQVRVKYSAFDRGSLIEDAARWPRPARLAEFAIQPARPGLWDITSFPDPHRFFEPWHDQICETAVASVDLLPERSGDAVGHVGGKSAMLASEWPVCSEGHGPMTLLIELEAVAFEGLFLEPRHLTLHACPQCLNRHGSSSNEEGKALAQIEWRHQADLKEVRCEGASVSLPKIQLYGTRSFSLPPAWIFQSRKDNDAHTPIDGVSSQLFSARLVVDGATPSEETTSLRDAATVYDTHYVRAMPGGVRLGGFPRWRFDRCEHCDEPLRQLLFINDYFTGGAFTDMFEGSMEMPLLYCDRTADCCGIEGALVFLDP